MEFSASVKVCGSSSWPASSANWASAKSGPPGILIVPDPRGWYSFAVLVGSKVFPLTLVAVSHANLGRTVILSCVALVSAVFSLVGVVASDGQRSSSLRPNSFALDKVVGASFSFLMIIVSLTTSLSLIFADSSMITS